MYTLAVSGKCAGVNDELRESDHLKEVELNEVDCIFGISCIFSSAILRPVSIQRQSFER